jgi:hypothetical protein
MMSASRLAAAPFWPGGSRSRLANATSVCSGDWSSAPPEKIHDQDDQEDDNENVKQDLSDPGSRSCDATETKQAGDKGYNQSHERVV